MSGSRISNRYIWESIGYIDYETIDMDGVFGAHKFDMNEPLSVYGFDKKFDLVTNFGTSEHIFNQKSFFENFHNSCKKSGLMLHAVPILGSLGHSLYLYQVDFFDLLARENKYEILGMWLVDLDDYYEFSEERLSLMSTQNRDVMLVALFRKILDSSLVMPYQVGAYRSEFSFSKKRRKKSLAWEFFTEYLKKYGVSKKERYRCAIFGAASAGEIALNFCRWQGIEVVCFIDDFASGKREGIDIIRREEFCANGCDFILKGCYQKGEIDTVLPVVELPRVVLEEAR